MDDRRIKMFIGYVIWEIAETLHWDLGRMAPVVFGWMVGSKGTKINKDV